MEVCCAWGSRISDWVQAESVAQLKEINKKSFFMDLCVEDVLDYWWVLVRPFFGSLPILFWRWSRGVSLFYAGGCNSLFRFMWGGVTPFLKVEAEGGVSWPQKYKVRGNLPKEKGVFFLFWNIAVWYRLGCEKKQTTLPTQNKTATQSKPHCRA